MKSLCIEWKHLDIENSICLRCSKTGKTINQVINELKNELKPEGIKINFKETKLSENEIKEPNIILINAIPLEEILSDATIDENYCKSCSCITGSDAYCRTIEYQGKTYEEIPGELIRRAVFKILKIDHEEDTCDSR